MAGEDGHEGIGGSETRRKPTLAPAEGAELRESHAAYPGDPIYRIERAAIEVRRKRLGALGERNAETAGSFRSQEEREGAPSEAPRGPFKRFFGFLGRMLFGHTAEPPCGDPSDEDCPTP